MRLRMILAALVVLLATAVVAQTFRGTILGTVTDTSGAVISGASVKIHNVDTGTGSSHSDQFGRKLYRVRTASRNLYGHGFAKRIPNLGDQQRDG